MSERAWETAMGMRGYIGSAAHAEDVALACAAKRAAGRAGCVLVKLDAMRMHVERLTLHWDEGKPYVMSGGSKHWLIGSQGTVAPVFSARPAAAT